MTISDETLGAVAAAYGRLRSQRAVAAELGLAQSTTCKYLRLAAERGLTGAEPVMPGFAIKSVAIKQGDAWVRQAKEHGDVFAVPDGHSVRAVSALVDAEGREIQKWVKTSAEAERQAEILRTIADELKQDLPRVEPAQAPSVVLSDLLAQYTVTDSHFGMLAHGEETGADYDLRIAEKLLADWFASAVNSAPAAKVGLLAQIGDLMHHDSLLSVTPTSGHVLDADSRLHKIVRAVIRTLRRAIDLMLAKHEFVHVIMASGNHDPASSVWIREMLAVLYEQEPRVSVDTSPKLYHAYEWGSTSLYYHHGHRRNVNNVDATLAGEFRELFGRTKYAYAHLGHLHSDEGRKSALMYVERHETLAARDAYAAGGGWVSGRSAKVICYSRRFGEVARVTIRPEMVAANDNNQKKEAA